MSTLIIVESYFGNTLQIAHAIAGALPNAKLQSFDEAPDAIPDDIDLLLLGAPTHETALPTPKSRHSAATRNSAGSTNRVQPPPQRGLAEWAKHATIPAGTRTITFDTSAGRFATMFGCAAKAAAKQLRTRGFQVERGPSFTVTGGDVLATGQQEQAAQWAASLLSKN